MAGKADVQFAGFAENAITSQLMIFCVKAHEFHWRFTTRSAELPRDFPPGPLPCGARSEDRTRLRRAPPENGNI